MKQPLTRHRRSALLLIMLFGAVGVVSTPFLTVPVLDDDTRAFATPQKLGRIKQKDIYYYVGDIALPNKINDDGTVHRTITHWDSFIITAPVPHSFVDENGREVTVIPWTMLPISVSYFIRQIDEETASDFDITFGVKKTSTERKFEAITNFSVDESSVYGNITKLEYIYGINLFEFMEDFKEEYDTALKDAISSSVTNVLQHAGKLNIKSIGVPALAGAKNVTEKEMVLSYEDSFSSILDGVSRVEGHAPSKIVIVVWARAHSKEELNAAKFGLEKASIKYIQQWIDRVKLTLSIELVIGFLLGFLFSMITQNTLKRKKLLVFLMSISVLAYGVWGSTIVNDLMRIRFASHHPFFFAWSCGLFACLLTILLVKFRILKSADKA